MICRRTVKHSSEKVGTSGQLSEGTRRSCGTGVRHLLSSEHTPPERLPGLTTHALPRECAPWSTDDGILLIRTTGHGPMTSEPAPINSNPIHSRLGFLSFLLEGCAVRRMTTRGRCSTLSTMCLLSLSTYGTCGKGFSSDKQVDRLTDQQLLALPRVDHVEVAAAPTPNSSPLSLDPPGIDRVLHLRAPLNYSMMTGSCPYPAQRPGGRCCLQ